MVHINNKQLIPPNRRRHISVHNAEESCKTKSNSVQIVENNFSKKIELSFIFWIQSNPEKTTKEKGNLYFFGFRRRF
jgi:hypothetical protein